MRSSRRSFMQGIAAGGIAFSLSRMGTAAEPTFDAYETLPGRQGWNPAARGMGRIDGVAKVTGAKLYASDFRAADMPGWPANTSTCAAGPRSRRHPRLRGLDLERCRPPRGPTSSSRRRTWRAPAFASPTSMRATCSARRARRRSTSDNRWRC